MRKSILVGLGLALSIAGTAAAQQKDAPRRNRGEQGGGAKGERGQGGPDGLLLKDITLAEGQRAQIAQLRKAQHDNMKATRGQGMKQSDEVRAARQRGDTAAVRAAMQSRRQAMDAERGQHLAAIRNVLTADQRVQFDKNVAELKVREQERGKRFGKGGEGSRGGKRGPGGERPSRSGR